MINVITELSKYVILTLMIVYTFHCFYMVWRQDEEEKKGAASSAADHDLFYRFHSVSRDLS